MSADQELLDLIEYGYSPSRATFPINIRKLIPDVSTIINKYAINLGKSKHNKAAELRFKARHKKRKK